MSNYKYVNVRMGTHNTVRFSNGNCYPVTAVPHGMNFFTIQSNSAKTDIQTPHWFYSPYSNSFEGIRLTHLPSPWLGDYGKLCIFAERGDDKTDNGMFWSYYDNKNVTFEPAYLKADVTRGRYSVEVAPTNTAVIMRFKFDGAEDIKRIVIKGEKLYLRFSAEEGYVLGYTTQNDTGLFYRNGAVDDLKEYICAQLSVPYSTEIREDAIALSTTENEFELRLSTSFLSENQAILNLKRELDGKSFEAVTEAAKTQWEEYLSKIEIEDDDEEKKRTFYSCMYRAFLWPRRFYELDENNKPYHLNTATGGIAKGYLYTDNGFWDTYRTLYPYLSLIDTKLYSEMAEGFYNYYVDTGWLPKWVCPINLNCMPGMLIEATMGDAIVKDIVTGELAENIFQAMLKDGEYASEVPGEGRVALKEYRKYGYIPYTAAHESVNETLDNTFGDFCIAQAAKKLGHTDIAAKYYAYSKNYKNLFDKNEGFIRAKDENGNFRPEKFNPYAWGRDYTEGSAWQNAFAVYHDFIGLDGLYDGKLQDKIDELMTAPVIYDVGYYGNTIHEMAEMVAGNYGQCAISNQPSFHTPYIYSELGNPIKTSYHVNNLSKLFNSGYEGYPGDEDNGSMSSWYLLSALGLYQVAPSRPDFATSVPLFDKITVKLANGKTLCINKSEYDTEKMSGKVLYESVMQGGNLADIVKIK